MDHYYTPDPSSPHKEGFVSLQVAGRELRFSTDAGVFSRERVDYGTSVFIKACPQLSGNVLDLGCGYGVLGLSLAIRFPEITVTLADINRRALALAEKNATALHIPAHIVESDGFSALPGPFDAVVTNPPIRAGKAVYYPWFAQAYERLTPGGSFVCVVQKKQGGPSVQSTLAAVFGQCEILERSAGFWALQAVKQL
jgi:16S rRNA (guanine1207-N2)-methyltransferase